MLPPGIETGHFDPAGWLWIAEGKTGKTGKTGWRRVTPSTATSITLCAAVGLPRKKIWPGYGPKGVCKAFARIARGAQVMGTSRYIRRGSASETERLFPGCGCSSSKTNGIEVTVFECDLHGRCVTYSRGTLAEGSTVKRCLGCSDNPFNRNPPK